MATVDVPSVQSVFREIMLARRRIYRIDAPTPVEALPLPSGGQLWVKREDRSRNHSFKWRGAANRMALLVERGEGNAVVAASAGNHAQGVALAAAQLSLRATIFMPRSTPLIKQSAVRAFGGKWVEVRLEGDTFDETAAAARQLSEETGAVLVHPFDDLHVIAGQGTIGDELVQACLPIDTVYVCVGGGGLAAGVGAALSVLDPSIEVVGVEAEGQAGMHAALDAGAPVTLDKVDLFCDGSAVRRVGDLTYGLCRQVLTRTIKVSNDQVCAAIEKVWANLRVVPEPSGALGVAAALAEAATGNGPRNPLAVLSGSNLDFMTLPKIARRSAIGRSARRFYAFDIDERSGSLVSLLHQIGDGCNIVEFQYGKTAREKARPVIGFEASPEALSELAEKLRAIGVPHTDVTGHQSVDLRAIPVRPDLFQNPLFAAVTFPDRGGALRELMDAIGAHASICYFNFASSGETQGRAMMAFELDPKLDRQAFLQLVDEAGDHIEEMAPEEIPFHLPDVGARL